MKRRQSIVVFAIVSAFVGMFPLNRAHAQIFGRILGGGSSSSSSSSSGGYAPSYGGYYSGGSGMYAPSSGGMYRSTPSGGAYSGSSSSSGGGLFGGKGLFGRGSSTSSTNNSAVRTNAYPNNNYAPQAPVPAIAPVPPVAPSPIPMAIPTSAPVDDPLQGIIATTAEPPLADSKEPAARPTVDSSTVLVIEVRLPSENVLVFVNNEPTKQGGVKRTFISPQLPPGSDFQYDVRAEWIINGQKVTQTKTVKGQAGDRAVADFSVQQ